MPRMASRTLEDDGARDSDKSDWRLEQHPYHLAIAGARRFGLDSGGLPQPWFPCVRVPLPMAGPQLSTACGLIPAQEL